MKAIAAIALTVFATVAVAKTATHVGELVSRDTKLCVYQAEGTTYTKTIKASEVCPKTIEVK